VTSRERTAEALAAELVELEELEQAAITAANQGDEEAGLAASMFSELITKRRAELETRTCPECGQFVKILAMLDGELRVCPCGWSEVVRTGPEPTWLGEGLAEELLHKR
jgi:hypothetical protein